MLILFVRNFIAGLAFFLALRSLSASFARWSCSIYVMLARCYFIRNTSLYTQENQRSNFKTGPIQLIWFWLLIPDLQWLVDFNFSFSRLPSFWAFYAERIGSLSRFLYSNRSFWLTFSQTYHEFLSRFYTPVSKTFRFFPKLEFEFLIYLLRAFFLLLKFCSKTTQQQ